ncbi:hypothetical protein [Streptomyces triticirhizae]|nr:hypothetical protein [Streptomyces triticirhizae]
MTRTRTLLIAAATATVLALTGCGGDDTDDTDDTSLDAPTWGATIP